MTQLELAADEPAALTSEQLDAVERRDRSLFLHAGAGSGKTRVLVERFVRAAVEDEVPVDRILAITFTDKAAAELRARMRARFLELGRRELARGAESAWVSTIHGFCSRVLRAHALSAGLDPEYRVLDEPQAGRIAIDAFDRALEEFLHEGSEAEREELVAAFTPDKLARMVRAVHSRLRSSGQRAPELPELAPLRTGGEREDLERAVRTALAELGARAGPGKTVGAALNALGSCRDALAALGEGKLGDHELFERFKLKRGNARALATPGVTEFVDALEGWLAACRAPAERLQYTLLRDLVRRFGGVYAELKQERSGLDFEDLQLVTRDLLASERGLREHYRGRFEHVMVDEFQDTNRLQCELLDLVADGNLFTVGDELQSIYLFRDADVGLFRERRHAAESSGAMARLTANFRSHSEVLDVLNPAFAGVFGAEFARLVPYSDHGRERPRVEPKVELLVVDQEKKRWEERFAGEEHPFGFSLRTITPWRAAEARLLAARVRELVDAGLFAPEEIAVLVRAGSEMWAYERALDEAGIRTYAIGGRGYWSQQQVGDLRAYLAALANPRDEQALCSLLASPIVGASIDALALIVRRARSNGRDVWWALEDAFCGQDSVGLTGTLSKADRERVASFARRFAEERRAAPRVSLETLIDRAVTDSGYDRAVLAMPAGARRMANVRKLMRLAREFEADEGRDLRGFIDFVGERELIEVRQGEAPLEMEGLDAVRIMTIHAAKGLEFPAVCVADLGRQGRGDDEALRVTDDGRVGLRLASIGGDSQDAMELQAIKREQEQEQDAEERRVFYVAMTRAREHLILSGATDLESWPEARPLEVPMAWVWRALAPGLRDAAARGGAGELVRSDGDSRARVRWVVCRPDTADEVLPASARDPETAAAGNRAAETADAGRAGPPPQLGEVVAPPPLPVGRLSYSGLEEYRRCGYRFYLERVARLPRADSALAPVEETHGDAELARSEQPDEELPALARGSIVHELLEQLDFRRPAVPSEAAVAERIAAHGGPAGDADVADIRGLVESFARSELCARLARAERPRRELPFSFTLAPGGDPRSLLINGVVDVLARERGDAGDAFLVVDYKSDRLEGRSAAAICDEQYGVQRLVYALAALRAGAERVEVVHCFLEQPDDGASAAYSAADAARLEEELLVLADGALGGRFEPSRDPHRELCHRCPGRESLCRWGPDRTLADKPAA